MTISLGIVNFSIGMGDIIPDLDKRFAVKEFVNTFDGFPERSMLTNEYVWPLRPEVRRAVRSESSSTASESGTLSLEEQGSRKRSAPWGAGEPDIIKKRFEMLERTVKTAARGVRARALCLVPTACSKASAPWRRRPQVCTRTFSIDFKIYS